MKKASLNIMFAALALSMTALAGCVAEQPAALDEEGTIPAIGELAERRHCATELVPQRTDAPVSAAAAQASSRMQCFDTFAESLSFATKGAVRLAADATPDALDRSHVERAAAASSYVLSIEYLGLWWEGFWGSHTYYASNTCDQGYYFTATGMGWLDNAIGSVHTFPGCLHGYHYDAANFSGTLIDCPSNPEWNCYYTMGIMNDRTSSILWTN